MAGTAQLFVILVAYLTLASIVSAMVVEDIDSITIGEFAFGELNNTSFTEITNISNINAVITDGSWDISSTKGLYSTGSQLARNEILFANTNQSSGWYNNSYHFKNPQGRTHGVYIYRQYALNNINIMVDEDGFWFRDGFTEAFYSYPGANEIAEYNLTTRFDVVNEWCTVSFNAITIFDRPASVSLFTSLWSWLNVDQYYCGVFVFGSDLEIHSLSSSLSTTLTEADFSLLNMLSTAAIVLFWNVSSSIIPVWMNILFIKIPGLGLFFIIVQTIRGTG